MADTDELPREEIEARMGAGLKRALTTPPAEKAKRGEKKRRPATVDQPAV